MFARIGSMASLKWNKFIRTYFGCQWPGWTSVALWTTSIVTLTYFTVRDIHHLQDDYYNNNTATQVEVIKNESIIDPEMLVCIPYYSGALENMVFRLRDNESSFENCPYCQGMKDHSWDIWRGLKEDPSSLDYPICENILQKLLKIHTGSGEKNFDVLRLNGIKFSWSQPIIDCIFRYFVAIAVKDFVSFGYAFIHGYPYFLEHNGIEGFDDDVADKMLELLLESISKLQKRHIKNQTNYLYDALSAQEKTEVPFLMLPDRICYPLFPNLTYEELGYVADFASKPPWEGMRGTFALYTDYLDPTSLMDSTEAIFSVPVSNLMDDGLSSSTISFEAQSIIVEARPNRLQKCSSEPNRARCVARHQYKDARDLCGCIPFTFKYFLRTNDSDLPYCNSTHYNLCSGVLRQNTKEHADYCSDKCEQVVYKWKIIEPSIFKKGSELEILQHTTNLRIEYKRHKSPFLRFTITEKTTNEQYTSQMGGIVNLYLGFSGLTACAVVIIIFDLFKRWFNIAKTSRSQLAENSLFSKLRLYWATRILLSSQSNENQQLLDLKSAVEKLQDKIENLQGVNADMKLAIEKQQERSEKQEEIITYLKMANEKQQELIEKLHETRIEQHSDKNRKRAQAIENVKTSRL